MKSIWQGEGWWRGTRWRHHSGIFASRAFGLGGDEGRQSSISTFAPIAPSTVGRGQLFCAFFWIKGTGQRISQPDVTRPAEFLLGVMLNQSGADFDVHRQWRAGTHLA